MICQTPLTQAKVKYILSPINDMQFSDRVQFETGQFHPYGPYSATTFRRTVRIETGNFQTVSDSVYWTTLPKRILKKLETYPAKEMSPNNA